MIDPAKTHQAEHFHLRFPAIDGPKLIEHFTALGGEHEDDFFYKDFPEHERWQAISIWSAEALFGSAPTDPEQAAVDELKFTYYLAALPVEKIAIFLEDFTATAKLLGAEISHHGMQINLQQIEGLLELWQREVTETTGEAPGSEALAIKLQDMLFG